jgi:glycosyltransferase involved in cell wall biosynthesis
MSPIQARLGLQQRVLPDYRAPFFDALAADCPQGFSLFAGDPRPIEGISPAKSLEHAELWRANNLHLLSGPFYLCAQTNLIDWLSAWNPEALILEANPRYLATRGAVRWMRQHDRPVLGWGLGAPEGGRSLAGLRDSFRRSFLRQFDAMITYSRQGAEDYRRLGFPGDKIFVAPNAVTPRPTQPPAHRPIPASAQETTLLFIGRLQPRKRIDLLLQACAALPISLQPRLVIIGDGPVRPELEQLARQIYPTTQFPGALRGAELEPYFTQADVFVLPGTGGLAVQQAMAHALPVIVAQSDGTQVDLVRPENGWSLPPADPNALLRALQAALSDLPALRQKGLASYRIVAEEINLENMVTVFERAVNSVWRGR